MNNRKLTLLQIDYFLAAAKYLNFTEAAKNLYISQPALSKQIATLETEIGVQLFYRSKRDVKLTPAGNILLEELNTISSLIDEAIEKSRKSVYGEKKTINIGCIEAMDTSKFFTVIVKNFKKIYPNVNIVLERHSFKVLREKLKNGSLDIIFTLSFEVDNFQEIHWSTVYKQNSSILMGTSNPLASKENVSLEELKNEDFLTLSREESPTAFDGIVRLCKEHGFTPRIVNYLPNIESLLLCVESGLGVALVDSNIKIQNKEHFKLFPVEDDFINIIMIWKKENINPIISKYTEYVLDQVDLEI